MLMPKTTVHKNNSLVFRENDIRFPRQILSMEPESIALSVQPGAYYLFRFGIFTADTRHT
jgi:hypothetical protein